MSEIGKILTICPPKYLGGGTDKESFVSTGHKCPCCAGNGWHWGMDERGHDREKVTCNVCGGSGELTAIVNVEWKPLIGKNNDNTQYTRLLIKKERKMRREEKNAALRELQQIVKKYSEENSIDIFMIGAISEKTASGDIEQDCCMCANGTPRYIIGALAGVIRDSPKVGMILATSLAEAGVKIVSFDLSKNLNNN